MPAGLIAYLRRCRRPIGTIAIGLVVLQVFLAGLATAQSATILAADGFDASVICHSTGDGQPSGGDTPDVGKAWHICCTFCTAAAPGAIIDASAAPVRLDIAALAVVAAVSSFTIAIAPRAVRAGPSQAPPDLV